MDISFIKDEMGEDWDRRTCCDFPYFRLSFRHKYSNFRRLYKDIQNNQEFVLYNPFDFTAAGKAMYSTSNTWNDEPEWVS